MNIKEAYKIQQRAQGCKAGDMVMVMRKAENLEMGWGTVWHPDMDRLIGQILTILEVSEEYGYLVNTWYVPFFVCSRTETVKEKDDVIKEAYKTMSDASGIKVGDTVRVMRKAQDYEMGWENTWPPSMDSKVGKTLEVVGDYGRMGFALNDNLSYPYFVLEKIPAVTRQIVIDGKTITISEDSFQTLKKSLAA